MTDRIFYAILRRDFSNFEYMTVKALEDETGIYVVRHNVVPPYPNQPDHPYFTRKDEARKALRQSGLVKRGAPISILKEVWDRRRGNTLEVVA